jgi:aarF domain-containing kinase
LEQVVHLTNLAHEYSSEFIDLYIEIIHAAAHLNREVCLRKSEAIGFLTGKESLRMQDAHVDSILTVGEPFHHEGEFDFGAQTITDKIYQLMPVMLRER